MPLKHRISSPLEAGPSVLDVHRLPPALEAALVVASDRLARRHLAVDLVLLRRDYQLPGGVGVGVGGSDSLREAEPLTPPFPLPAWSASACSPTTPASLTAPAALTSPTSPAPPTPPSSRFRAALQRLARVSSHAARPRLRLPLTSPTGSAASTSTSTSTSTGGLASPSACSTASTASIASTPWTGSSSTDVFFPWTTPGPGPGPASTPSTSTVSTPALTVDSAPPPPPPPMPGAPDPGACLRLVHDDALPARTARLLRQALDAAARRSGWAAGRLTPVPAGALGLPPDLVAASVRQNDVLFGGGSTDAGGSSLGLTLRAADQLYTFKAALHGYAQTRDPLRREDAVDELRRYVLARGGRPVSRRALAARYPGWTFGAADLADVGRMYGRAYGGAAQACGMEGVESEGEDREKEQDEKVQTTDTMFLSGWEEVAVQEADGEGEDSRQPDPDLDAQTPTACSPSTLSSLSALLALSLASPSVLRGWTAQQRRRAKPKEEQGPEEDEPSTVPATAPAMAPAVPTAAPVATATASAPPSSRPPVLRLQTTFDDRGRAPDERKDQDDKDDKDDDQLTARPDTQAHHAGVWWAVASIGEVLQDEGHGRGVHSGALGSGPASGCGSASASGPGGPLPLAPNRPSLLIPPTPNRSDDISPTTRSEWGFLMGGQLGRQVTVTTFS